MPIRSPSAKREAPGPRRSTTPTISWPGTTPARCTARSPSATWRSVRHTPQTETRTRTSPGPGSGSGRSDSSNGPLSIGAGAVTDHALIRPTLPQRPRPSAALSASALVGGGSVEVGLRHGDLGPALGIAGPRIVGHDREVGSLSDSEAPAVIGVDLPRRVRGDRRQGLVGRHALGRVE